MSIRIERGDPNPDRPGTYHVKFTVTCDAGHGLFTGPSIVGWDDYVEFRREMSNLGWVERSDAQTFHCPGCVKDGPTDRIC